MRTKQGTRPKRRGPGRLPQGKQRLRGSQMLCKAGWVSLTWGAQHKQTQLGSSIPVPFVMGSGGWPVPKHWQSNCPCPGGLRAPESDTPHGASDDQLEFLATKLRPQQLIVNAQPSLTMRFYKEAMLASFLSNLQPGYSPT